MTEKLAGLAPAAGAKELGLRGPTEKLEPWPPVKLHPGLPPLESPAITWDITGKYCKVIWQAV